MINSIRVVVFTVIFASISSIANANANANTLIEINKIEKTRYNEVGTVSISSFPGSMDDVIAELKMKGKKEVKNANHIYITSLSTPGDSSRWMGTAIVYD